MNDHTPADPDSKLITWCRLMRVGPACAKPCDDCRHTSRKYNLADADIPAAITAFYDPPPTDEPSGFVLTRRGIDYLKLRRQQHPKEPA